MFERNKLNRYLNSIVGFAYEFSDKKKGKIIMQLYLVIEKDNKYKMIKYKEYKAYSFELLYCYVDEYQAKPVSYYVRQDLGKQLKKKKS